ncbi:cytoplasmic dynein 1 intermediate chain 2-like isoform X1 [Anneissia japonica]|uniref:cytoplasmic dynein 1 intermediate chain 2-like isoform X1 n=1 Tax=Anneissia japonica TaxID=1529436 RepID=UPI0014259A73|nr:cytoplasmic dynein 1 intermediate chain 2-like isoform X1 [Anneissia japonica]
MSDRKAELEAKKKRLQEIRDMKKKKDEDKKKKEVAGKAAAAAAATASPLSESDLERKRRETDDLLRDILPEGSSVPSAATASPIKNQVTKSKDESISQPFVSPKRKIKLGMSPVNVAGFPPKELVTYAKETQTPVEEEEKDDKEGRLWEWLGKERHHRMYEDDMVPDSVAQQQEPEQPPEEEKVEEPEVVKELSSDEKQQIINSSDFQSFFDRASRVMERALFEESDIFMDYTGEDRDREGDKDASAKLSLNRQFFDDRWSRHRVVSSLDWSNQYPELLVASYNNNEESPHEPDGVALVWNMKYKKSTPEYIFHCQSPVMSASFARFHPNLVVGGTYSGQIVLWDNRSYKRTPVQRTPLSAAAHTHPVYCVSVVGTQNAHNLISVSTDGKMCSWNLDMLSQPQDSMELQHKQSKSVAVTCMDFPTNDVNNFVVGSEEGAVYTASRHGSKAGINEVFEGHQGPVTGIDCNHVQGQIDFSHLFLTSSFDWTIKLWSTKQSKPVYSFEDNSDYIYDVMWSPIHPALFASVDSMGRLDVWNLNNDTEVPSARVTLDSQPAINRVRWAHSGYQIAAGDADGRIWIYDVGESFATPRMDEWSRFVRTLTDIKANAADIEADSLMR